MRALIGIVRIIVGVLFIFSGLVKLNDPMGFSFKLEDYFAPDVLNLEFLIPYALMLATVLVIVEVLLGLFLLLGYLKRFTVWSLLLMIVFFTFLTFYSAYFNKVTDCGCFGDAIPLTPWQSFWKDVILLILIVVLTFNMKYIQPVFTRNIRNILVLIALTGCLGIAYYVLQHLPIIDFRAYKIGTNIEEGMAVPEDAPQPVFEYRWKFLIDGKEEIITTFGDYPQVDGEFVDVDTKMISEGYIPPIHDFMIERDGEDFTEYFLNEDHVVVVIAYSLFNSDREGFPSVKKITDRALAEGYHVIGLSASSQEMTEALAAEFGLNFKFYFCDETTLKTIIRSNPGIVELERGTIKQKYHWNDAEKLKLKPLDKTSRLNMVLKNQLDSIADLNRKFQNLVQAEELSERISRGVELGLSESEVAGDLTPVLDQKDSLNMVVVEKIFQDYGYPGKSLVGESSQSIAASVLQRSPEKIERYLPVVLEAAAAGELPSVEAATLQDMDRMIRNEPQIYGTQAVMKNNEAYIWPVENPENVNQRRKEAGFKQSLEDYGKELFGSDFEYRVLTVEEVN